MKFKIIAVIGSLSLLCFFSCTRETTLRGVVLDVESSLPLSDVRVQVNEMSATTTETGAFIFKKALPDQRLLVTVSHPDYVSVTKRVQLTEGINLDELVFPMLKRKERIEGLSTDSISVSFGDSGGIDFAPNSWVYAESGDRYRGLVQIQSTFVNSNDERAMRAAPGSLVALDRESREFGLQSFGMVEIYATDEAGTRLDISKETPAEIRFPSSPEGPTETGLYLINPSGFWIEMGTLTLNPVTYTLTGTVTSISEAWNADDPCADPLICVSFNVVDDLGNPLQTCFSYRGLTYQSSADFVCTDSQGYVEIDVCPNQVFEIFDIIPCCDPSDVPGTPEHDFCCVQGGKVVHATIDLSTVTITPPCTNLGTITFD